MGEWDSWVHKVGMWMLKKTDKNREEKKEFFFCLVDLKNFLVMKD